MGRRGEKQNRQDACSTDLNSVGLETNREQKLSGLETNREKEILRPPAGIQNDVEIISGRNKWKTY
ncbi:MAG: hypothetical protein A2W07_03105 [candidate division Zixibacteria bacterium RBG_16_43_9]|nr:MAG: hypothetical protein A2W07_03105 [candidate division Zixibacteria bacterium RBG_16_43_9]